MSSHTLQEDRSFRKQIYKMALFGIVPGIGLHKTINLITSLDFPEPDRSYVDMWGEFLIEFSAGAFRATARSALGTSYLVTEAPL